MNIREKTYYYLYLLRIPHLLTVFADTWIGYFLCGGNDIHEIILLPVVAILMFIMAAVLNDYVDYKLDLEDHPKWPLPCGAISTKTALTTAVCAGSGGLILSAFLGIIPCLLNIVACGLFMIYVFNSKRRPTLGILMLVLARMAFLFMGIFCVDAPFEHPSANLLVFPTVTMALYNLGILRIMRDESKMRPHIIGRMMVLIGMVLPLAAFIHATIHPQFVMQLNTFIMMGLSLFILMIGFKRYLVMSAIIVDRPTIHLQLRYLLGMTLFFQAVWLSLSSDSILCIALSVVLACCYFPFCILARYFTHA